MTDADWERTELRRRSGSVDRRDLDWQRTSIERTDGDHWVILVWDHNAGYSGWWHVVASTTSEAAIRAAARLLLGYP